MENPDGIRVFKSKSARDRGGASADQEADQEDGEGDESDLDQARGGGGASADQEADQEGGEGDELGLGGAPGMAGDEPYCPMDEFQ